MRSCSKRRPRRCERIAADPRHLGAEIGFVAVLHTWGQNLHHHPHVHCVVPGGGLSPDGTRWIGVPARLLPAGPRAVAPVPRAVSGRLRTAFAAGALALLRRRWPASPNPQPSPPPARVARASNGSSMPSRPFGGPAPVLAYLGRYTHRVAIANSRLGRLDRRRCRLPLEGLSPPRQDQGDDARRRRVHPALPAPHPAGRFPPHPPLRLPRQWPPGRQAGALPGLARGPAAGPVAAPRLPRATRSYWRRHSTSVPTAAARC